MAARKLVTCESKIVTQARLNPLRICWARLAPRSFSSRMRSNTSTLASTAMPIVSARPASPDSENVAWIKAIEPDQQDHVHDQRDDRDGAREPVIDHHEEGHDQQRHADGEDPLGDGVVTQRRSDLLLLSSGVGSRLAGKLPARKTWIRCSTSFCLNPCGPTLDDALTRESPN